MLVKEWARLEGLHPQTVWKWCRQGTMPVPVEQTPTGMWLIHDPKYETASQPNPADSRTVCYARVSSGGRKGDLQRQADRLKAFAVGMGVEHPEIVTEKAQGRRVVVVDDTELDDDLVRDMTEALTSFCARLYGRRAAKHRAEKALEAMRDERV